MRGAHQRVGSYQSEQAINNNIYTLKNNPFSSVRQSKNESEIDLDKIDPRNYFIQFDHSQSENIKEKSAETTIDDKNPCSTLDISAISHKQLSIISHNNIGLVLPSLDKTWNEPSLQSSTHMRCSGDIASRKPPRPKVTRLPLESINPNTQFVKNVENPTCALQDVYDQNFSDDFTIEAIGMPLLKRTGSMKIGDKESAKDEDDENFYADDRLNRDNNCQSAQSSFDYRVAYALDHASFE
jgi:hypothetical protein